jgi:O-antigen/teichoic acid export membrane protein
MILDFRTREAMTRYLGEFAARGENAASVAIVKLLWLLDFAVVTLAFMIVAASAPVVAPHLTDHPDGAHFMRVFAVAMFFGTLDATAGTVLRVYDRFGLAFASGAGAATARLMIVVILIGTGAGLNGLIWGRVVAEVAATAIIGSTAVLVLAQALNGYWAAPIRTLSGRFREIGRFLLNLNLVGLIKVSSTKLDVLTVGALAGPSTASLYKIAVQFGSAPLLISDPLAQALYPAFTRWRTQGRLAAIRGTGRKAASMMALVAVPVAVIVALTSERLLSIVVGSDFADAWLGLTIVMAGVVPSVIFFWGGAALLAVGDASAFRRVATVAGVVQFGLLFSLVPLFGWIGAAVSLAGSSVTGTALGLHYLRVRRLV